MTSAVPTRTIPPANNSPVVSPPEKKESSGEDQKTPESAESAKPTEPASPSARKFSSAKAKFGDRVQFNPLGNPNERSLAFALTDPTANGHIDLVTIGSSGTRVHRSIPHSSTFETIESPRLKRNGSWDDISH